MQKTYLPLDLDSLVPTEATFQISGHPNELQLKKWTLKVKQSAISFYGEQELGKIFTSQNVVKMSEIVYKFMLKAEFKAQFEKIAEEKKGDPDAEIENGFDAFLTAIVSPKDQAAVVKALVATIGIGEPELKIIEQALKDPVNKKFVEGTQDPNEPSLNP